MVNKTDTIVCRLSNKELRECIATSTDMVGRIADRNDLHSRSYIERFINILMGEMSEQFVIKWIQAHGKHAESAVDKQSDKPDLGHDIWLMSTDGRPIKCSVKSSLSAKIPDMDRILDTFKLASTKRELRDVNVQVYFWLEQDPKEGSARVTVPSETNAAIIGWIGKNDAENCSEKSYSTEKRPEIQLRLRELNRMEDLLQYII